MERAVIYIRVSSAEQVDGTSLETQERDCRAYCECNSIEVLAVFKDAGESAKTADRPQFKEMVYFCSKRRRALDYVLVHKTDRFARSADDFAIYRAALSRYGVRILSATEPTSNDPAGKLMQTILSGFAQFDNELRADRSRTGMETLAKAGYWTHRAPVGYLIARDDAKKPVLKIDPTLGPIVVRAFELIANEGMSQTEAYRAVQAMGLAYADGREVSPQSFHKLLRTSVYCGRICNQLTDFTSVSARFRPLIGPELFDHVQVILANQKGGRGVPHCRLREDFPLRRCLQCGSCGGTLTGCWSKGKSGKKYAYYICGNKVCRKNFARDAVEEAFMDFLQTSGVLRREAMKLLRVIVKQVWAAEHGKVQDATQALHQKRTAMERKRKALLDKLLDGTVEDAAYRAKDDELANELAFVHAELHDLERETWDISAVLDYAEEIFSDPVKFWRELPLAAKPRFVATMYPGGLSYSKNSGVQTLATDPVLESYGQLEDPKSCMAPPTGFEPHRLYAMIAVVPIP
jgi:DNA invertase Pin-like site-specific DNA recombinase